MSEVLADVMIHIRNTLQKTALEEIQQILMSLDGVASAKCNPDKPHLIMIEYDSDIVNSFSLLEAVKAQGYSAGLVGL